MQLIFQTDILSYFCIRDNSEIYDKFVVALIRQLGISTSDRLVWRAITD